MPLQTIILDGEEIAPVEGLLTHVLNAITITTGDGYVHTGSRMSAAGTSLYSHARKRNEVGYVAPVQRQIQNAQVVDHRAYSSAPRLDLGRIRLYFHLLGHLPDFKN